MELIRLMTSSENDQLTFIHLDLKHDALATMFPLHSNSYSDYVLLEIQHSKFIVH